MGFNIWGCKRESHNGSSMLDAYCPECIIENLNRQIKELKTAMNCELRDPSGPIWDHLVKRIQALESIIQYTLDIKNRSNIDDYAYDDCWQKMKDVLKDKI